MRTLTLWLLWIYMLMSYSIHHYSRLAGASAASRGEYDPKRDLKNLERPTEVYTNEIIKKLVLQYNLDQTKAEYTSTFSGEYTGKVEYRQFKLKDLDI